MSVVMVNKVWKKLIILKNSKISPNSIQLKEGIVLKSYVSTFSDGTFSLSLSESLGQKYESLEDLKSEWEILNRRVLVEKTGSL